MTWERLRSKEVCIALQDMLTCNKTLQTLQIDIDIMEDYTKYLITGLQGNSTLHAGAACAHCTA